MPKRLRTLLQERRLSLKVLAAILACSSLVALAVASIQLYTRYLSDTKVLEERLADAEVMFLDDLRESLWRLDEPMIKHNIRSLTRLPFITRAQLLTAELKVYSAGKDTESPWVSQRQYAITYHFAGEQVPLGKLNIWVDQRFILTNLKRQAWQILVLQTSKTLIVSFLILAILHFFLFRHLRTLYRTAMNLSADDLSTPFQLKRNITHPDELGSMCDALENMRLRLRDGLDEIHSMQSEMQRVFMAANSSPSAIAIFNADNGIRVYSNSAYENYFGARDHLMQVLHIVAPEQQFPEWLGQLKQKGSWKNERFWPDRDQPRWLSTRCLFYRSDGEELILVTTTDISELRQARDQARHLLEHDNLTGLPNLQVGLKEAQGLLTKAERESLRVAMVTFSLEAYKAVKESFGSEWANRLVQDVAELLDTSLPDDAQLARSADNQFLCVQILHKEGDDYLLRMLEQLRSLLAQPIQLQQQNIDCGFYAGVALYPRDGGDVDTLYQRALSALQQAENQRTRIRHCFFDTPMDGVASRKLKIQSLLNTGAALEELDVYYQPLIDTTTGHIVSFEALARWHNAELGFIPPPEFIAAAEDGGQIVELGELIMQTACLQLAQWRRLAPALKISVNISPLQLLDPAFESMVANALQLAGLPPQALKLEVTEQLMLQSSDQVLHKLNSLQSQGIQLAIDDFGSGYASLNYLSGYPFELLKIDQSFIMDILQEERLLTLTRTITELAHSLGLKVVAEGVETTEIASLLQTLECDLMQGYLFSRPLPAAEVISLLEKGVPWPPSA